MRHLLLCLALALPVTSASAAIGDAREFAPEFQVHQKYLYIGDGMWVPRQFSRDDGYFHGRGGGVQVASGQALFDYDRDYPYDFPSERSAGEPMMDFAEDFDAEPSCTFEAVRDRRSGASASVRICR